MAGGTLLGSRGMAAHLVGSSHPHPPRDTLTLAPEAATGLGHLSPGPSPLGGPMALTERDRAALLAALLQHQRTARELAETAEDDPRRDVWRLHESGAALAIAFATADRLPLAAWVRVLVRLAWWAGRLSR